MIIGINGKIGSGKDTIGSIIQYLVANKKLPKNMQYSSLEELDNGSEPFSNWKIKKFAEKLKTIASLLTGIPVKNFEDQEFKKTDLDKEWSYAYPDEYYDNGEPVMVCMSVRQLLQKLGTDALRDNLHENVWVNALMADYNKDSNWIVTDCRFPNEAKIIEEKGGILLRVERSTCNLGTHPSETALDNFPFEHVIFNNGSMDDLRNEVKKFLESIS